MRITKEVAGIFIDRLAQYGFGNVNIMNDQGVIIASHDKLRVGALHEGSIEVMRTGKEIIFEPDDVPLPKGTRPGVTIPILFHGECVGAVGVTGEPSIVYQNACIIRFSVESLLEQQDLHHRLQTKRKLMESWVLALVSGNSSDLVEMESYRDLLGIDPESLCCAVAISLIDEKSGLSLSYSDYLKQEDAMLAAISAHEKVSFHGFLGQGLLLVALALTSQDELSRVVQSLQEAHAWFTKRGMRCGIGIGSVASSLIGFPESYRQATHSARLIEKLSPEKRVMSIRDFRTVGLIDLVPDAHKRDFQAQFLGDRPPISEVQWRTLEIYLAHNQSLPETASALHIHRNTLLYRLQRIKDALHLDPHVFQDAVVLQILVFYHKLI